MTVARIEYDTEHSEYSMEYFITVARAIAHLESRGYMVSPVRVSYIGHCSGKPTALIDSIAVRE